MVAADELGERVVIARADALYEFVIGRIGHRDDMIPSAVTRRAAVFRAPAFYRRSGCVDSRWVGRYNTSGMMRKHRRKVTAWAVVVFASIAVAGVTRASWLDWLQGLGSSDNSGQNTTAVAAVRGLGDDDGKDSGARNFSAIDKLDKLQIGSDEVARFARQGHLAP